MFQFLDLRFAWTFRRDGMIGPIVFKIDRSGRSHTLVGATFDPRGFEIGPTPCLLLNTKTGRTDRSQRSLRVTTSISANPGPCHFCEFTYTPISLAIFRYFAPITTNITLPKPFMVHASTSFVPANGER